MEIEEIVDILQDTRPEADMKGANVRGRDLVADGLLDSFDIVVVVCELQKRTGLHIPGDAVVAANFRNAASIKAMLDRLPRGVLS